MTEETFTELVNLYLDKEISESGLARLKAELAANPTRKAEFQERCRLHQAMRLALNPEVRRRSGASSSGRQRSSQSSRSRSSRGSRSAAKSSRRVSVSTRIEARDEQGAHLPRWFLGSGLAACVLLGFVLLPPVFRDTTSAASQPTLQGVDAEELVEEDPLDRIGRAELRRFASIQEQRAANQRASLAAQLRLMGLRPELTPEQKELRPVSVAAIQPEVRDNAAAVLDEVQKITPIPTPQIFHAEAVSRQPSSQWPGGFHSSLASFR